MISSNTQEMIPKIRQCLVTQPVEKAWLFGSFSRGEERTDSDVDILVQYEKDKSISLFTISRIMTTLQKALNKNVDLIEEDCLLPFAVETANRDKILIYERANHDKNLPLYPLKISF